MNYFEFKTKKPVNQTKFLKNSMSDNLNINSRIFRNKCQW